MTSTERDSYNERGSYKCDGIPMDPPIMTAARALAAGDPLGALKRVALRDDAVSHVSWGACCGGLERARRAATADPKSFVDMSVVHELESSGLIKQLYKKVRATS